MVCVYIHCSSINSVPKKHQDESLSGDRTEFRGAPICRIARESFEKLESCSACAETVTASYCVGYPNVRALGAKNIVELWCFKQKTTSWLALNMLPRFGL